MDIHYKTFSIRTILIFLVIPAMYSPANDWPQWRGPRQDGISHEDGLLETWPEDGPQELWRITLGKGYSAVSVVDGRAYTMYCDNSNEYVVCLDIRDGKILWRVRSDKKYKNAFGDGPRATPTLYEGRVYTHGASGSILCLNAETGVEHWSLNSLEKFGAKNLEWGLSASPAILDDKVIIVAGGKESKSLVALDKEFGEVIWASLNDKAGYSTPILIEVNSMKQVAVFTGEAIVGVALEDGKELWRFPWKTNYDANIATPIYHNNRLFISSGYDSGAVLLGLTVQGDGTQVKVIWKSRYMKNQFSSSVLVDGFLYGFSNTIFTCMDFNTGEVKWIQRGFYKGSLLVADGKLIIYSERAKLVLAEISPDSFKQLAIAGILKGKTWTVPTLSNGRLYVRNQDELVCLKFTP